VTFDSGVVYLDKKEGHKQGKNIFYQSGALLTESLLDAGTDMGSEILKESMNDMIGELAVDTASSFIPGVYGAVNSFKRKRAEKNIVKFVKHLHEKHDFIIEQIEIKTQENNQKIDEMMYLIINHAMEEIQEEKIEYMVNGFAHLTEHDEFTEDFVLLYYDVLKQLRMVDIAVLKIHYNNKYTFYLESNEERESFQDVMVKHGLSYEQYLSVRENLRRLGLLEINSEDNVEENLKELQESISKMKSHYDRVLNGKRAKK